jgi:hypothetical protein
MKWHFSVDELQAVAWNQVPMFQVVGLMVVCLVQMILLSRPFGKVSIATCPE